ncbi:alanyl-tRNA editing protein [candidate division KSB1 bacterium]|nr:alanyl-tRNA editing protein [candidate division KSB1 bacterium]
MTEEVFRTDSYASQCEAVVTAVDENGIQLDRTVFYPMSGGQPGDTGVLRNAAGAEVRITDTRKGDVPGQILHIPESQMPALKSGDKVTAVIDWDRRYRLMRTHTAMHILCGVMWRDYGAQVTGGNMEPCTGRLDFELESMSADFAEKVGSLLNKEVEAARAIKVKILPREEALQIPDLIRTKINLLPEGIREVRTLEIVGLDLQADGGTHVANTQEVGPIRIVEHKSKGKINKRIRIAIDEESGALGAQRKERV